MIFEVFPKIFSSLGDKTGILVGSVFFILLSFAAITSTVSLLEVPAAYLVDDWNVRQERHLALDLCEDEVAAEIGDMAYSEREGTTPF